MKSQGSVPNTRFRYPPTLSCGRVSGSGGKRSEGHLDHSVGKDVKDSRVEEDRGDESPPLAAVEDQTGLLGAVANLQREWKENKEGMCRAYHSRGGRPDERVLRLRGIAIVLDHGDEEANLRQQDEGRYREQLSLAA